MSTALLDDLPQSVLDQLEHRAARHGQSPTQEAMAILEAALAKGTPAPEPQGPYGQETGLQDWSGFQPWQLRQRSA